MKKFLFLIREDITRLVQLSQAQMDQEILEMNNWVRELATFNNFIAGEPLENEGKMITRDHVPTDGPFTEAKEGISGYMIIQAENLEQAASIAERCPHVIAGTISIEVRPVMAIHQ